MAKNSNEDEFTQASTGLFRGSVPGMVALALSLACALGYAWTQHPSGKGFKGEVERQWRDGALGLSDVGSIRFASGDLAGHSVADPQFNLALKAVLIERSVEAWQNVESCAPGTACKIELRKVDGYVDASKFKTPGIVNPLVPTSLTMASSAKIGRQAISSQAVRSMSRLAIPYVVGLNDFAVPGAAIVNGGYQNFNANPTLGSYRITYRQIPVGVAVTLAGDVLPSGQIGAKAQRFLAKVGSMPPEELLGLEFWQLPRFGYMMLFMCAALFAGGMFGLWSTSRIAREMDDERRRRDRRQSTSNDRRRNDRRAGQRRDVATPDKVAAKASLASKPASKPPAKPAKPPAKSR